MASRGRQLPVGKDPPGLTFPARRIHPWRYFMVPLCCALCLLLPLVAAADGPKDAPKSRSFLFTYAGTISGQPADKVVSVWLPVPPSTEEQSVEIVSKKPADAKLYTEPWYNNQMLYFETKPDAKGDIP